ncbi:MAG: hypothetical protein GYB30_10630 [Gammaproteobacteria bacterium]|nr:hypothetical protein [Gammaproteobacteria bacterium]
MKLLTRLFAVFMLLVGEAASADVTFVHTDVLGSPMAETNSAGQLVRLSHYKAYGEELEQQSDDVGYTGHKYDADLALSYMQARYYDPVIGRFYSNDPVGFRGVHSFNRYAYANNNPYKYIDPDGKQAYVAYMWGKAQQEACKGKGESCATENAEKILGGMKDGAEVFTRAGNVITAVEIANELANDRPVEDDIDGAIASELTNKAVNPNGKVGLIEIIANFFSKNVGDSVQEDRQERQKEDKELKETMEEQK